MLEDDIKPCPFCGSKEVILTDSSDIDEYGDETTYYVWCKNCGECSEFWEDPDDAIGQWNKYIPREDFHV